MTDMAKIALDVKLAVKLAPEAYIGPMNAWDTLNSDLFYAEGPEDIDVDPLRKVSAKQAAMIGR